MASAPITEKEIRGINWKVLWGGIISLILYTWLVAAVYWEMKFQAKIDKLELQQQITNQKDELQRLKDDIKVIKDLQDKGK